jgi:hypothetical protein
MIRILLASTTAIDHEDIPKKVSVTWDFEDGELKGILLVEENEGVR